MALTVTLTNPADDGDPLEDEVQCAVVAAAFPTFTVTFTLVDEEDDSTTDFAGEPRDGGYYADVSAVAQSGHVYTVIASATADGEAPASDQSEHCEYT